jgi:hypothetical protein
MSAKTTNAIGLAAVIALLMFGSHVNGMVSTCVELGGTWEGYSGCRMPDAGSA